MATPIEHNVRIIHLMTGEHVICNFTQIREEDKFVAYQMLYPLTLTLSQDPNQGDSFNVTYRRWNPFTPYEDHRVAPTAVITAMPPSQEILDNYVNKLKEAGVDCSFLPNNGDDIIGEPTQSAATEGPVADSED
jgi:hypothetical protein|tara:strand:+ start:191 stop:592 length:402 start_codon:yes stop_codon:yes gene_type:complete